MNADAIVALGCRIGRAGPVGASARRVERALEAYQDGVASFIVVSGGRLWHGVAEAAAYREAMRARGVPEEHILAEGWSQTTLENARYTKQLFDQYGWTRAALVTCDWHLPRARFCFERFGLRCVGLGACSPPMNRSRSLARQLRETGALMLDRIAALRA